MALGSSPERPRVGETSRRPHTCVRHIDAGGLWSAKIQRRWLGPRLSQTPLPDVAPAPHNTACSSTEWAVITSIYPPTRTILQLAAVPGL
eukprot:2707617-Prymnesium_polylepis.1